MENNSLDNVTQESVSGAQNVSEENSVVQKTASTENASGASCAVQREFIVKNKRGFSAIGESTMTMFCPSGKLNAEDALPILTDRALHIADGLGGSGGFAHSSIKRDAIDNEKFFDTLFRDVFPEELTEDDILVLRNYVNTSFEKYFSLSDEDKLSRSCICTSGYFASRIASTLLYSYVMAASKCEDSKKDKIESLLSQLAAAGDKLAEMESEVGNDVAARLFEDMGRVANNANLIYDAGVKGLILLPSTMVTVLYKEETDYVDAVYLWAGDSRGYIWDKNGLVQLTEDHEREGIMTNMVNLVARFKVSAKYVRVKKPCMLFATSDGCYTCMSSPLDFDYYFFSQFKSSASLDEAKAGLYSMYAANSQDDSNTISLRAFGYSSYEELRAEIAAHLDALVSEYDGELPGIFELNFRQELSSARRKLERALKDVDVTKSEALFTAVLKKLSIKEEIEARRRAISEKINACNSQIYETVKNNFVKIAPVYVKSLENPVRNFEVNILSFVNEIDDHNRRLEAFAREQAEHFEKTFSPIYPFVLKCDGMRIDVDAVYPYAVEFVKFADDIKRELEKYKKAVSAPQSAFSSGGLAVKLEEYLKKNIGYASEISAAIISRSVDISVLSSLVCYGDIEAKLAEIDALKAELSDDSINKAVEAKALEYWKKNSLQMITELYESASDSEFFAACDESFVSCVDAYAISVRNIEKRDALYEKYNEYYYGKKGEKVDA